MKLAKALKEKNKKVKNLNRLLTRIRENNSYKDSKKPTYDVTALMKEFREAQDDLIAFKTAISLTNAPIQEKIYRLAETKSFLNHINMIPTIEGPTSEYSRGELVEVNYIAVINELEKDKIIKESEDEIEKLQDEIDYFNATTDLKGYTEAI